MMTWFERSEYIFVQIKINDTSSTLVTFEYEVGPYTDYIRPTQPPTCLATPPIYAYIFHLLNTPLSYTLSPSNLPNMSNYYNIRLYYSYIMQEAGKG